MKNINVFDRKSNYLYIIITNIPNGNNKNNIGKVLLHTFFIQTHIG